MIKGELVIYINDDKNQVNVLRSGMFLTNRKQYRIIDIILANHNEMICIINDLGYSSLYNLDLFQSIDKYRNEKIKQVLK